MIIKGILLIIAVSVVCHLSGDYFLRIIGWKRSFAASYVWGLVLIFALFHLIAYPMYRLGTSFSLLFWSFFIILALVLLCALMTGIKQKNLLYPYSEEVRSFFQNSKKYVFLVLVFLAALTAYFFMSEGFYYSSSDDGLYITKGMEALAQNSLAINDDMAWYGRRNAPITNFENGSTYSFFLAILSKCSGLPTVAVTKTFFLFNLLLAHLAAVLWVFDIVQTEKTRKERTEKTKYTQKLFFLISYIVFQLFCVKEGSAGTWMTGFLYEGKAILIGVMFPLLLGSCLKLLERIESFNYREWISIAVVLLAGVEVSVIGVIFPLVLYFSLGVAILIGTRFRYFRRVWIPAVLAAIPVVVFALFSFFSASSYFSTLGGISTKDWVSAGQVAAEVVTSGNKVTSAEIPVSAGTEYNILSGIRDDEPKEAEDTLHDSLKKSNRIKNSLKAQFISWKDNFLYAVDFWQFVLYCLSALYILFRGTRNQRIIFVYVPIVLLITFANPFLCDFVASKITTPIVYWRIFWLFPVYLLPAVVCTEIVDTLTEGNIQRGVLISILGFGIISGYEVFRYTVTDPVYSIIPFAKNVGKLINVRPELRHNIYGLNAATVEIAEAVLEDWEEEERPRLLFCFNRPFEIRQFSSDIIMAMPVRNYDSETWNIDEKTSASWFMNNYSSVEDGEYLRSLLEKLEVDYVLFNGPSAVENLEDYGFKRVEAEGRELWKVEKV
ncbi:MAG: DUF6077 domain-containing protein [Eubacteriales bacterium]|nr:DUF6077 domain-containing protein [Eubacteriales bacterium]